MIFRLRGLWQNNEFTLGSLQNINGQLNHQERFNLQRAFRIKPPRAIAELDWSLLLDLQLFIPVSVEIVCQCFKCIFQIGCSLFSHILEMRCYRKILPIPYKDHVTDEEVRAKVHQAIGPPEDLLAVVKRCKLKWYGHVSRSSSLDRTIVQGTVKGGRRQGRQKKRLEDNIREWTGQVFSKSQRAVENREKWRKLVVKSSVASQRPRG